MSKLFLLLCKYLNIYPGIIINHLYNPGKLNPS